MSDMKPITPLGGAEPRVDTLGAITVTEVTETALASYAARLGSEAKAVATLEGVLGQKAPAPGTAVFGDMAAFWTGPDQWMVMAPIESHELLADELETAAAGQASVTEQTDGWCRFDVTGPALSDVFERLCPVNLRSFTGGEATRTSIDHLGCFVICVTPEHVSVIGPRSSAGSLHHALLVAIRSAA